MPAEPLSVMRWMRIGTERWVALAILAGFVLLRYADPAPLQQVRLKTFDFYQQFKPRPVPKNRRVLIVDVDETSLQKVGQWPWPRTYIAKLVRRLTIGGARVIAFDVLFPEPDRFSGANVAAALGNLDETTKKALERLRSNDDVLAQMIGASRRVVVGQGRLARDRDYPGRPPLSSRVAERAQKGAEKPQYWAPAAPGLLRNIAPIERAAAGHGMITLIPEQDGIVRRVPAFVRHGDRLYPALSVEMLRLWENRSSVLALAGPTGIARVAVGRGKNVPTDRRGQMWPYFSPHDPGKFISAVDVLTGKVGRDVLDGKMVLIGTSATGLLDVKTVPTAAAMPGVEVHAQIIESLLSNSFLSRPPYIGGAEIVLTLVVGLMMILLVPWAGAKWAFAFFVLSAVAAGGTSWFLFDQERILFDAAYALMASLTLYVLLTVTSYVREEGARRQTRDAFAKYMSPAMVERVVADPSLLTLGGAKRDLTVLFCDVRGFTSISEMFDAEGLTELINKLLTPLTDIILARGGTVDKYMGDCIMAFWNAPLDEPDHVRQGCLAALEMVAAMEPLNARLDEDAALAGRDHVRLAVGLGLNTGEAVVGNMGTAQRMDYSVLGDTVNTASRLEGQSKTYGVDIVIGPDTAAQVPDLATLELDNIQVKGKTVGLKIFGLLGDESVARDATFEAVKTAHTNMLAAYRAQDWTGAQAHLAEARRGADRFGLEALCDLYEARIHAYEKDPPPADWDGIFVATTK